MNLERYLASRQRMVERALKRHVPAAAGRVRPLAEAMRYTLFGGGKRLRPILVLATAEALGADRDAVMPFACAAEMIHTYSLIHDDLPAMDDDATRRGKPTNHLAFGEGIAILAGDALLTDAFRIMAESAAAAANPRRAARAIREIAEAAGTRGMVGGQVADLRAEGTTPDLATVEYIHVRKTGALILACIRGAALLAAAREAQLRRLTRYGERIGMAFQITDDILDVEAPPALTGKDRGRDQIRGKATFPAVMGVPAAKIRAGELVERALDEIGVFPKSAEPLRAIARQIAERVGAPRR